MPERLTVVFEDESLHRRLKMRAAADGLPIKRLIEDAVREYLGPDEGVAGAIDWTAFDRWQQEVEHINRNLEPIAFGRPELAMLAEEKAVYEQ